MRRTVSWIAVGGLVTFGAACAIAYFLSGVAIWLDARGGSGTQGGHEDLLLEGTPHTPALKSGTLPARGVHPLLGEVEDAVFVESDNEVSSTVTAGLHGLIGMVIRADAAQSDPPALTIDYPLDETVFPPEIVPPTFLWHEPAERADTWLLRVAFADSPDRFSVLLPGAPPPAGEIDPRCIADTNQVYQPTPYQASARSWTPGAAFWAAFKRQSQNRTARITLVGFRSGEPEKVLSRGQVAITTSGTPVGTPIFYRDVPLAPSKTEQGVIKPLSRENLPLIAWRLRDIAEPRSRLLLTEMGTCANCHSFSADGKTLGMDLDGPGGVEGDKGAYVIVPVAPQILIEQKHVISWNSFPGRPPDTRTIGFMSQMSPDGQYAVTTLNEATYTCNFMDYKFLQVFYPTRGILACYSRANAEIKALPGADDPQYVHCNPAWSPDGEWLVFARAVAVDPYPENYEPPARANDPGETPIRYDLYRIPFASGRGGRPEPIAGAVDNGMSNSFPKVSPDGKWIVFVRCRNGQLMRPDSELWIVPFSGGTARRMRCNTSRMNSWHSFSPNGGWMVFSSKSNTPYTQMFLTRIDEQGHDSPAVLIPDSTAANRAVNIPEFVNLAYDELAAIDVPAIDYLRHGLRGLRLFREGKFDEALAEYEAAVALQPDYLEGKVNCAIILAQKGQLDEATARLRKVIVAEPKYGLAHTNLGVILAREGDLDGAIDHFKTAVTCNPNRLDARSNLVSALLETGRLDEATVHLRDMLQYAPDDLQTHFRLGRVLADRGLVEEAVPHLERARPVDPQLVDGLLARIRASNRAGSANSLPGSE